jgi:tRNA modification GTPase
LGEAWVGVSAERGEGLEELARAVGDALAGSSVGGSGRELSLRHSLALQEAAEHVREGRQGWGAGMPLELLAEELRAATAHLDEITGRTTPEDLLDQIFARFCLGK